MYDIIEGILAKVSRGSRELPQDIAKYLADEVNIEQLITLYEAAGTTEHIDAARDLKSLFREELEERVRGASPDYEPALFAALLDMHSLQHLDEQLILVMTTNYEDLIEQAMQDVFGAVNYVIKTDPTNGPYDLSENPVPFLKLHGSFNWKNESPVMIQSTINEERDVIWIPPGVAKNREDYPFDLIWGKARELLDCDVLRIIGSSLSMNDWGLVSLVHTTQKPRADRQTPYSIEIIDYPSKCRRIKNEHKYLNMSTVLDIPEFSDYLVRSYSPAQIGTTVPEERLEQMGEQYLQPPENMFAHWLRAKGEALFNGGISLGTTKGYFENFVFTGLR